MMTEESTYDDGYDDDDGYDGYEGVQELFNETDKNFDPLTNNNFHCNTLTTTASVDTLDSFSGHFSSSNRLSDIDSKLLSYNLAVSSLEFYLENNPKPNEGTPDIHEGKRKVLEDYKASIKKLESEKAEIQELKSKNINRLELPKIGKCTDINIQNLRLHVPVFDNENGTTILESWTKLTSLGEALGFSEETYKLCLSNILQLQPFEVFFLNKEKSLKDILEILNDSFNSYESLLQVQEKLDSIERKPNETISAFVNRVSFFISKTDLLRPEEERAFYKKYCLTSMLKANVSTKCKIVLNSYTNNALRNGHRPSFEEIFEVVKNHELQNGSENKSSILKASLNAAIKSKDFRREDRVRSASPYSRPVSTDRKFVNFKGPDPSRTRSPTPTRPNPDYSFSVGSVGRSVRDRTPSPHPYYPRYRTFSPNYRSAATNYDDEHQVERPSRRAKRRLNALKQHISIGGKPVSQYLYMPDCQYCRAETNNESGSE